jgi:hypothetical protein
LNNSNPEDDMTIKSSRNNKSKLVAALRRRFGNPAAVLRALGLDESLVDVGNTAQPNAVKARMAEFKVELSQWLSDHAASLPEVDGGGIIGRILALLDQEDVGAEDVGPDVEGFRKLLRDKGWSDADIGEAIRLAQGGEPAADRLPVPATKGGLGGYGNGVKVAADERKADELDRMFGTARVSLGLDYGGLRRPRPVTPTPTARVVTDFNAMFPDAARIDG